MKAERVVYGMHIYAGMPCTLDRFWAHYTVSTCQPQPARAHVESLAPEASTTAGFLSPTGVSTVLQLVWFCVISYHSCEWRQTHVHSSLHRCYCDHRTGRPSFTDRVFCARFSLSVCMCASIRPFTVDGSGVWGAGGDMDGRDGSSPAICSSCAFSVPRVYIGETGGVHPGGGLLQPTGRFANSLYYDF